MKNYRDGCGLQVRPYVRSYLGSASIDGFKFLGDRDRSLAERIFWGTVIVVALGLSIALVLQTWIKWIHSPVIVTFSARQTEIGEIPFPTVTICPQIKVKKNLFNFTDYLIRMKKNETVEEMEDRIGEVVSLVCNADYGHRRGSKSVDNDVFSVLGKVVPKLKDFLLYSTWKERKITNFSDYFYSVITSAGFCYTFNGLKKSDLFTDLMEFPAEHFYEHDNPKTGWDSETGYVEGRPNLQVYPRRTTVDGSDGGLLLVLVTLRQNLEYACQDIQGYKISVHDPEEMPNMKDNYFYVSLSQYVTVSVKPKLMVTSSNLRAYDPKVRGCYFSGEKPLRFFAVYNQRNCLMECLANVTYDLCGCVNYYMPQNVSTPICSVENMKCMDKARSIYNKNEMNKNEENLPNIKYQVQCDCLPSCTSLQFDIESSQSYWEYELQLELYNSVRETMTEFDRKDYMFSGVQLYFKDLQFTALQRDELYGHSDFWANVGGVVGLFTGFSFVTIFEILYYLSLRWACNIFGRRRINSNT